jgi:putative ABC transport system permease protein
MNSALHTASIELDQAVDPTEPTFPVLGGTAGGRSTAGLVSVVTQTTADGKNVIGMSFQGPLYLATPALLAHYGIGHVDPNAGVLSSRTDLNGLRVSAGGPKLRGDAGVVPTVQRVTLPNYTSDPNALITLSEVHALGLLPMPSAWLITSDHALSSAEVRTAQRIAAGVGLVVESRTAHNGLGQVRNDATTVGILVALGVLAMTVGLIRSEGAGDLRTLAATGAGSRVRRTITSATAGTLALIGGVLGVAGAYLALIAWNRSKLTALGNVPYADLAVILIGLPIIATAGSWLVAGRQPAALGVRQID